MENEADVRAFSYREVGERCGVAPRTVKSWVASGALPTVRISETCVRILPADLQAFLEARRVVRDEA